MFGALACLAMYGISCTCYDMLLLTMAIFCLFLFCFIGNLSIYIESFQWLKEKVIERLSREDVMVMSRGDESIT